MTRPERSDLALAFAGALLALAVTGCSGDPQSQAAMQVPAAIEGMKGNPQVGARIYQSNCTACHSPNPSFPGSIGPDVKGASRDLIEARIMHAKYPEGYTPKRATHSMVALPHLEPYIDDLAAYLR